MDSHYKWKAIVYRILKWFFRVVACLLILVFLVLVFFNWKTNQREIKTLTESAPATGHFVTSNNTQIFIQEAGPISGQAVLLVHGTGAWSEIWRETMTALGKAGFHAIAIDLPPFGYSERLNGVLEYSRENQAKRIIGVLDALNIKNAILVGHSVGARPTIEATLENPEKISKLILVDPALGFQTNPNDSPHFEQNNPSWIVSTLFSIKPLRKTVLSTYGTNPLSTKKLFSSFVSQKTAVTDFRVKMLQKPLVVEDTTSAYGDWLEYLTVSQDSSLASDFTNFKKLTMPVFIIWGSTDSVTPLWQGDQLKKLIPNSELSVIDNVGHIPYIENVEKFNAVLLGFLKRK